MILERIQKTEKSHPEKKAIVFQGKSITYSDLLQEIYFRGNFYLQNISNKYIILSKSDVYENFIDFLSLISIGKICIFSSNQVSPEDIVELKNEIGAIEIASYPYSFSHIEGEIKISQFLSSDIFLGVLTSGTTSKPKVIWKDYQSWFSAFSYQSEIFGITESDRLFVLDALSYSANLNAALHMIWQGGTVVLTTLNSAKSWHNQLEEKEITSIFMVPSHYRLLVKNKFNPLKIKSLVSAGEKLDYKTTKKLIEIFPDALLTEYYGASELGHISYHQNQDILDYSYSVGKAFPQVKISIENQEIIVESPYISPDFRNKKTVNDLGFFENERLIILGRSGRMFNKRGLNVFAEEIENKVQDLEFIEEVATVGKLRADGSHDIFLAFSTNDLPSKENIKNLKRYLLQTLPSSKQPKKILQIRNLPHKDFGKIDYQEVMRLFEEENV